MSEADITPSVSGAKSYRGGFGLNELLGLGSWSRASEGLPALGPGDPGAGLGAPRETPSGASKGPQAGCRVGNWAPLRAEAGVAGSTRGGQVRGCACPPNEKRYVAGNYRRKKCFYRPNT